MKLIICFILVICVSCIKKSGKKDDIIYYNAMSEPSVINPIAGATDAYNGQIMGYIFESLLERDQQTYEWKHVLATDYQISKDKKVFEFNLRPNVYWHDGKEFTAEDVKFSFDLIFDDFYKVAFLRSYYEAIEKVEIVDKYKVKFYTKDDYYGNFDQVAGLTIFPKHFYGDKNNQKLFNKVVIGSGPYIFDKHIRGQKIILKKNPKWWGSNLDEWKSFHRINRIAIRFITEPNISLEMFKKGNLDFMSLTPELFVKKTQGKEWGTKLIKVQAVNKTPKGFSFIGFNFKNPLFKDVRVRRALSMLFNRELMRKKFEYELSESATGPIYVQSDYAPKDLKPIEFDPKGALKLLRDAGFSDSDKDGILDKVIDGKKHDLSFTILDPVELMSKYTTVFKEDARKIGVDINIKITEWNTFVKLLDEKKFEAVRLAWGGGGVDWDPKQIWHSSSATASGSNFISYSNPEVDRLIDQSRKIYDRSERIKILNRVAHIIAEDCPYIFFFNGKYSLYAHSKRIKKEVDTYPYSIGQANWVIKKEE